MLASIALIQCTNETKKEAKLHETYIVEEEITLYAFNALDSVYSVRVQLTSKDTAVLNYWVALEQGGIVYKDSLNFSVPAGETVNGQIIFPDCNTKNFPKPTLTSKVKRLE